MLLQLAIKIYNELDNKYFVCFFWNVISSDVAHWAITELLLAKIEV